MDLRRLISIRRSSTRVRYELVDLPGGTLDEEIENFVSRVFHSS
jgi:hypothetical protein